MPSDIGKIIMLGAQIAVVLWDAWEKRK